MWDNIKERIFPFLIALSALSISASAAFYSVTGLSKLFAGASFAVIIMASSLEISKLVIASLLYQYWDKLNKGLKVYLTIAVIILIFITSAGIYGFLSGAYQETSTKSDIIDKQIELLATKKSSFEKVKVQYETEKQSITENISTLRNALGNNNQSYKDANGNIITYSSSANRKAYEKQLEVAIQKDEQLTNKIQTFNDSIISLETRIVEVQSNTELVSELGPLKYLSNITGKSMDAIINYLLLVIIFVFDPLAIALVIAANFAFTQLRKDKKILNIPEKDWVEDWPSDNDEDLETASLEDLEKWEKDEEEPYQIYVSGSQSSKHQDWEIVDEEKEHEKEIKSQNGVPVMIDPKTGKFFYEEQEPEIAYKNLDLNNDGIIDENELKQVFNNADLNNDGIIDENESKIANLDPNTASKLNQLNNQVDNMIDNFQQYYRFNPEQLKKVNNQINEIKKLSIELSSIKNKNRDDDNTITYF